MPGGTRGSTPGEAHADEQRDARQLVGAENSSSMSAVGSPSTWAATTTSPGRIWRAIPSWLIGSDPSHQQCPVDLAGGRHRQFGHELDDPRLLVGAELLADVRGGLLSVSAEPSVRTITALTSSPHCWSGTPSTTTSAISG